jgi:hypothetical protein
MSWQEAIQQALERRDAQEKAYSRIIEHCEPPLRSLSSQPINLFWVF